ncbi:MAG: PRC-barrel domain-containing protein, partial [Methanomicrobiales archaeon]|nr:PRC-barrel domain-containing protein [Methanomicrobiales archaeon]
NAAGEDLGEVHEIMLDVATGRIAYAVLAYGGVLGMGEKLFAVPWERFAQVPGEDYWILDVSKEDLDRAKGFDRDHWPMTEEVEWYLEEGGTAERGREPEPYRSSQIIGLEESGRVAEERRPPARVTTRYVPVQRTEYVPVQTIETERRERR